MIQIPGSDNNLTIVNNATFGTSGVNINVPKPS